MSSYFSLYLPSPLDYIVMITFIITIISLGVLYFIRTLFKGHNWSGKHSALGKTIIVTGANSGIGKALAEEFGMRGADHVVLACRNEERASKARDDLIRNGADPSRVSIHIIDLMSFKSVRDFAKVITQKFTSIDVLICNAGVLQGDGPTEDGNEKILQANYLGHFLLVEKLRSMLQLKRVVFVSSLVHKHAKCEDLTTELDTSMQYMKQYSRAKLAEVSYAKYLSTEASMEAYSCNPGVVHTNILAGTWMAVFDRWINPIMDFTMKSPLEGAQTPLMLALSPAESLKAGAYYSDCALDSTHPLLKDSTKIQKMYDQSKELCRAYI